MLIVCIVHDGEGRQGYQRVCVLIRPPMCLRAHVHDAHTRVCVVRVRERWGTDSISERGGGSCVGVHT